MTPDQLEAAINEAWDARESIDSGTQGAVREAVEAALNGLDAGSFRVAEKQGDTKTYDELQALLSK